jgi:DNA-binding IclR family transcriptional regulator
MNNDTPAPLPVKGRPKRVTDAAPSGTAALEKGLDVLAEVGRSTRPLSFAQLMAGTGLPRSTLHRILSLLVSRRLLAHEGGEYRLGIEALALARTAWEQSDIRTAAGEAIRTLARAVGEAVHLATLVDREVVYLDKVESNHPMRLYSAVGKRGPVHCTAVGKAILAYLSPSTRHDVTAEIAFRQFTATTLASPEALEAETEAIRRDGIAFDREEHQTGVHCIAAPIFDFRSEPAGAISITCPVFRVSRLQLEGFAPLLRQAADTASRALGGTSPWTER